MFLYRKNEIEILKSDFLKPNSSFNFIFGRKKVGKTFFVKNHISDKESLYLNAFECTLTLLLKSLKHSIDSFFKIQDDNEIQSFEELFIYISKQTIENKIVIVFEDINNLIKLDKDFISNFYSFWNKYLKNKNIQFILTSSFYPSSKEENIVFNKANNIIKLKSLPYNIIDDLIPNLSDNEKLYVYSTFGTNPQYLRFYDKNKDFFINLESNFLNYNSLFYDEGMNIIKNDLSDIVTYSSILYAISLGNRKIGDIASFLNLKSSYLTRYMQKLVDLMILEKIVPINENPSKSKFGRYEIEDNFLKFWFAFIYPNKVNKKTIKKEIDDLLLEDSFIKISKNEIEENLKASFGFIPNTFGSWWNNKDIEIDVVAYNSKEIVFLEYNYKHDDYDKVYTNLVNKSKSFDTTLLKNYIVLPDK